MSYLTVTAVGNHILERYIGEDGEEHRRKVNYEPTFFLHSQNPTGYKDIYGRDCIPKKFDNMKSARSWKKDTESYYDVLGMDDFEIAYISDTHKSRKPNMSSIRIANVDIEVPAPEFPNPTDCRWEIKSIVHYDNILDAYMFFGIPSDGQNWVKEKSILKPEILERVVYIECLSEKELLLKYIQFWKEYTPVIVTGWNTSGFDLPYIAGRIQKVIGATGLNSLSPWGLVRMQESKDDYDNITTSVVISGVEDLDYMRLYDKFTFTPRASMRLDYIGECEVNQKKVEFNYPSYLDFYNKDYQLFGDYNIGDVDLVRRIDEKLRLLQLAVTLGYYAGINFSTVFGTLKPWDAIIFNSLKKDRKVVPMAKQNTKTKFIGAYVKIPEPGYYRDIESFDFTSLYPSIIRQCNISPECIIDQFVGDMTLVNQIEALSMQTFRIPCGEYSASANGMLYTKEFQGVIPIEITKVFSERKAHKKKMLEYKTLAEEASARGDHEEYKRLSSLVTHEDIEQQTRKIQINSLYGALGNAYFRYYDSRNAEAVTSFGQVALKWTIRAVNDFLNQKCRTNAVDYIIYGDTDSIYVDMNPLMKILGKDGLKGDERVEMLNKLGKIVEENVINPACDNLTAFMNNYEKQLFMDREAIALTGFFLAKKRYALSVSDMENVRYSTPKLKIMGIETQRSSTPVLASKELKESIRIILQEDQTHLQNHVSRVKDEWAKADYKSVSYVSSANNLGKYSDHNMNPLKGCPGHVKGVLAYNRLAKEYHFDAIQEGNKVALLKLKEPNRYGVPNMAYPSGGELPNEIDPVYLKSVIDYNLLYQEKFESPLKAICEAIKWEYEKSYSLSDFF